MGIIQKLICLPEFLWLWNIESMLCVTALRFIVESAFSFLSSIHLITPLFHPQSSKSYKGNLSIFQFDLDIEKSLFPLYVNEVRIIQIGELQEFRNLKMICDCVDSGPDSVVLQKPLQHWCGNYLVWQLSIKHWKISNFGEFKILLFPPEKEAGFNKLLNSNSFQLLAKVQVIHLETDSWEYWKIWIVL